MSEFQSPSIDYAAVSPLLIVFGVALLGVIVEAFAPRRVRYAVQSVLTLAGLAVAFAATVWVATDLTERAGERDQAECPLVQDPPGAAEQAGPRCSGELCVTGDR